MVGAKKQKGISAVLEFVEGPKDGQAIKIRRDSTILGREKGDIILDDREVSSTHCQIQCVDGVYHIFDMNSTNGTFLNGQKVLKAALKASDLIQMGTTTLRFALREDRELRNAHTVFRSKKEAGHQPLSVAESMIESELRSTNNVNTIVIHVTYDNGLQEEISLKQRVVYIGRASSFGHFDQDPEVSRKHLMIKLNDNGEVFVEDQGTTNGSKLNNSKINGMHLVRSADTVKIGGAVLKISTKAS
jgi:pSer/pThr/pTyr-binding forkhead associated (FHA) protein